MRRRPARILLPALALLAPTALALGATATATAPAVTFRGAQQVSDGFSRTPAIATDARGRMTAAWTQVLGAAKDVQVSQLVKGGWTLPAAVPGSTGGEDPVVAVSPNGTTAVAWDANGLVGVNVRTATGRFGTAAFFGSRSQDANSDIALAVSDSGRVLAAWTHADSDGRSVQGALRTGGTWSSITPIDGGSASNSASGASVAIDSAGNGIVVYTGDNPQVSDSEQVRQVLVPSAGTFGAPTVLQEHAFSENDVDTNPRVASNGNGQVVAGWGVSGQCECSNIFWVKVGWGTTTTGITASQQVSAAGDGFPATLGPNRKAGGVQEVAIDELGNRTMVWDATDSTITGTELWAAHVTPAGQVGPSSTFGTAEPGVATELHVAAADGRVLTSWVSAHANGSPATAYVNQAVFPGAAAATWGGAVAVSQRTRAADSLRVAFAPSGLAAVVLRATDSDRIWANTNAPRDRVVPRVGAPRSGAVLRVVGSRTSVPITCPRTEAECIVSLQLTRRTGRLLLPVASTRVVVAGGTTRTVGLTVTRLASRGLATAGTLAVSARIAVADDSNNRSTTTRSWTLRPA